MGIMDAIMSDVERTYEYQCGFTRGKKAGKEDAIESFKDELDELLLKAEKEKFRYEDRSSGYESSVIEFAYLEHLLDRLKGKLDEK